MARPSTAIVARGAPTRDCTRFDEPEITMASHYAQILVPGAELHHYQDYGASMLPANTDKRFCWLVEWAREINAVLIVIDTAFRFLAVRRPIAIADYGAMHPMMSRFQRLVTDSRASVLLLHHAPKTHGSLSPLGSQAIGGAVDSVLTVTRDAGGTRYPRGGRAGRVHAESAP